MVVGPQHIRACPIPGCTVIYRGFTERGADALMAMHVQDHKRGWAFATKPAQKLLTGSHLTEDDRKLLAKMKIRWDE